jgi:hypothetical protein
VNLKESIIGPPEPLGTNKRSACLQRSNCMASV